MKATTVFKRNWEAMHARNPDGSRKYRYVVNKGSSRSSKTISLIDCYDLTAREESDWRLTVWRDTKTDCKKTVLVDAIKHLRRTGRYGINQTFNKTESIFTYGTGSTFEIHGTDDEETVHGLTQDIAWLNEPYKISRETFDQIDQRTSEVVFIDWNPKKAHWIEELLKDPRTIEINSTFRDNPFCPPEQKIKILSYQPVNRCALVVDKLLTIQEAGAYNLDANPRGFTPKQVNELRRCRGNEDKNTANDFNWMVYGLGLKGERPNRIFRFTEIPDEQYKALDVPRYYGVDWGAVDPWAIVEAKYYDGALYLHELNYTSENEIRSKLNSSQLAAINGAEEGLVTWGFARLGIDKNADIICDTNRPSKITALRSAGYIRAQGANKAPGSIIDGISMLRDMPVYYTKSSVNLGYEQENYSRKVDRYGVVDEEPEDCDNHLCDAIRYVRMHLHRIGVIRKI